jgi:hypothetical protein
MIPGIKEVLRMEPRNDSATQKVWNPGSTRPPEGIHGPRPEIPLPEVKDLNGSATHRRILLVDDHPVVRIGLAELLNSEPDLEVCGHAEDHVSALRQVEADWKFSKRSKPGTPHNACSSFPCTMKWSMRRER